MDASTAGIPHSLPKLVPLLAPVIVYISTPNPNLTGSVKLFSQLFLNFLFGNIIFTSTISDEVKAKFGRMPPGMGKKVAKI